MYDQIFYNEDLLLYNKKNKLLIRQGKQKPEIVSSLRVASWLGDSSKPLSQGIYWGEEMSITLCQWFLLRLALGLLLFPSELPASNLPRSYCATCPLPLTLNSPHSESAFILWPLGEENVDNVWNRTILEN